MGWKRAMLRFNFLGKKKKKKQPRSLFFPSPFHPVGIRPGAGMQNFSPSLPRGMRAAFGPAEVVGKTEVVYSGESISSWQAGKWKRGAGRRRKASFKNTARGRGWFNPGGRAKFFCPPISPAVPPCRGGTFEIPFAQRNARPQG